MESIYCATDMVAFIRGHVYTPEYKLKPEALSTAA